MKNLRLSQQEHDDLVDSSTQALLRFRQGGFVSLHSDEGRRAYIQKGGELLLMSVIDAKDVAGRTERTRARMCIAI